MLSASYKDKKFLLRTLGTIQSSTGRVFDSRVNDTS